MKIKFVITSWRDTAYSSGSCDGYGEYNRARHYSCEMTHSDLQEMHDTGEWAVDGNTIAIDYEDGPVYSELDGIRRYGFCTLLMNTSDELEDDIFAIDRQINCLDEESFIYDSSDLKQKEINN